MVILDVMIDESRLQIALKILQKWKVNERQIQSILLFELSEAETNERTDLILQIDRALKIMFNNSDNIYGFMRMRNKHHLLDGLAPLELINQDNVKGLKVTLKLLRGMTSG